MDVRIDLGDEIEEEDFEDEILDGELVDVEEELPSEVPLEEPAQMPPVGPPPKAPKPGAKKPLMVVAIVIVVILAVIFVYIFLPRPPSSIALRREVTSDGLRLIAEISSDSATASSGTAKITITHNGLTVYENNNWKISSNSASKTIPWDEFVMDNGEYSILVEYEGVSDEIFYDIDFVLKNVAITVYDETLENGPLFYLSVGVGGENNALPRDSEIRIASIEHEDGVHHVTTGINEWIDVTNIAQHEEILNYDLSGIYTITVDVKNNDVQDSSDYAEFSVETDLLINSLPDATLTWQDESGNGVVNRGERVDFDGRNSDDDGDLIYNWSIIYTTPEPDQEVYSDPDTDQTSFTFDSAGEYYVYLTVSDPHGQIVVDYKIINVQF